MISKCPHCKSNFSLRNDGQIYCSRKCEASHVARKKRDAPPDILADIWGELEWASCQLEEAREQARLWKANWLAERATLDDLRELHRNGFNMEAWKARERAGMKREKG